MRQDVVKRWMDRIRAQKLFALGIVALVLALGLVTATALTTGVSAARGQAAAPDATPLTIPPVHKLSNDFTKLAQMLEPSVVFITTEINAKPQPATKRRRQQQQPQDDDEEGMTNPFGQFFNMPFGMEAPRKREGSGSGFIVDKNGYIITNLHVVDKADSIKVKLTGDKTEYKARLIGFDSELDVAVIKIDAPRALTAIKVSNSDGVQVGDWAVAIGAPFGLETSVTAGIVSATGRDITAQQFQHFIQTDAAINPGNSGGPLVNINGEVIGINTMIATNSGGYQGIGFALPINSAVKAYNQIISTGGVSRGSIGIKFPRDEAGMSKTLNALGFKSGVIIESVQKGGPAEAAGVKGDDIVVSMNGKPIKDGNDLVARIADLPPGTDITLGLDRDGKRIEKTVRIEDRAKVFQSDETIARNRREMTDPNAANASQNSARFGIGIKAMTDDQRKEMGYDGNGGVQVTVVEEGSFAEEIGVRERDVIASINRQPVASYDDVKRIQEKLKPGDSVAFKVMRPTQATQRGQVNWQGQYLSGTLPRK
jgi:serine protease Do